MDARNNFKKLIEEEEAYLMPPPEVARKVDSQISFFDFFGKIIELFIPKILELMVVMTGGAAAQLTEAEVPDFLPEKGEADEDNDIVPGDNHSDKPEDRQLEAPEK